MTSRDAIRTAIVIGGIWLIISALTAEISNLVWMIEKYGPEFARNDDAFSDLVALWASALLALLVAAVLPGAYAIHASERWANRISPENSAAIKIETTIVIPVAATILGLSLGSSGAVALIASSGILALKSIIEPPGADGDFVFFSAVFRSATELVIGVLLFRWGSRRGVLPAA